MTPIHNFIHTWTKTAPEAESETTSASDARTAFLELYDHLNTLPDTDLDFIQRPGVSYSLRPRHRSQKTRPLFAMVDVIDDDPAHRWLSVCFYGEMITDPDGAGDLIPGGLLGEDGFCFDISGNDPDAVHYLKQRLSEAHRNACE